MIRTIYSAAVATAAVAAALAGTAGTASAATPTTTLASANLVLAGHHGHHWHHWHFDFHPGRLHNANAQKILQRYFGDLAVDPGPSSGPTMLSCPNPPGPGQSSWSCVRRPVGSAVD